MEKKVFGLCAGRHTIPVGEYIFPGEINPTDFGGMYRAAAEAIGDVDEVVVYVTGLTAAMLAVAKVCADRDIGLTAMHYDREAGTYNAQVISVARRCGLCGQRVAGGGGYCPHCAG